MAEFVEGGCLPMEFTEGGCLPMFGEEDIGCQTEPPAAPHTRDAACGGDEDEDSEAEEEEEGYSTEDSDEWASEQIDTAFRKLHATSQMAAYERRIGLDEFRHVKKELCRILGEGKPQTPEEEEEEKILAGRTPAATVEALLQMRKEVDELVKLKSQREAAARQLCCDIAARWGDGRRVEAEWEKKVRAAMRFEASRRDLSRAKLFGYPLLPHLPPDADPSREVSPHPASLAALEKLLQAVGPPPATELAARCFSLLDEVRADKATRKRLGGLAEMAGKDPLSCTALQGAVEALERGKAARDELVELIDTAKGSRARQVAQRLRRFAMDFGIPFTAPEGLIDRLCPSPEHLVGGSDAEVLAARLCELNPTRMGYASAGVSITANP